MKSSKIKLLILALLCGDVAGFSSGILLNMNKERVQNHFKLRSMKEEYGKKTVDVPVFKAEFTVKFLKAFSSLLKKYKYLQ